MYRGQDPGQRFPALPRGNASSSDSDSEPEVSEGPVSEVKDMREQREDEEMDARGKTQLKVDTLVTNLVSKGHSLTPGRTGGTGTGRAEVRSCLSHQKKLGGGACHGLVYWAGAIEPNN